MKKKQTKRNTCDSKAIKQIEFVGHLKSQDGINADGTQTIFVLTI